MFLYTYASMVHINTAMPYTSTMSGILCQETAFFDFISVLSMHYTFCTHQGRSQGGFKGFGRTPFSELSFLNRDTG